MDDGISPEGERGGVPGYDRRSLRDSFVFL